MADKYLILGNGIAGFSAARSIRREDPDCEITMIGEEKENTYLRPLLSKTDFSRFRRDKIYTAKDSWYEENRITVLKDRKVSEIDRSSHTVRFSDGTELTYKKCIYALGATCFVPPISGKERKGVLTLRTVKDFHELRRKTMTAKNAVFIGGGIIGIEMAWELHKTGIQCIILEAAPRLMARRIDEESSRRLREHIEGAGIECHTGVEISELTGDENVTGVRLSDGRWFPGDMVVLSTGVCPVIDPAKNAGLDCDRAVRANEYLLTSDPDIFAAGDCVQCSIPNPGLWKYAKVSGDTAGYNAVHTDGMRSFRTGSFPMILTAVGMGMFANGITQEGPGITTEVRVSGASENDKPEFLVNHNECGSENYQKRFYRDGKLCGIVLMGNISEIRNVPITL
ncbi:NAD(P)/FAD-dependent oxidoreductase [Oribacterium sp. WCC10]|uniref:NAD(P)/FAD-dependent oxidoreductase n=1 Tax=Oribacterium sp. WCC10 TaxID=1855343 RepID=UPI0008E64BDA|nr:FAD-dependent oxidoreductase [Oribacterium sp. WCC10]SFG15477.1 Pyridine nucleotide-disulphide oxidoreductase [Oribacterium sp. WCC10]